MNRNRDKSKNCFDNRKPGSNPQPYRKQDKIFQANKNFNRYGMKPYIPAANVNKPVASGANATSLQIKCWKCSGPNYAQYCKNKTTGVLCNLQEELTIKDIAVTPRIYAALDG